MKEEVTAAAAKVTPPAVVGVTMLFGLTLNEWVAIATLFYIGLQTFFLLKDRLKKSKERQRKK